MQKEKGTHIAEALNKLAKSSEETYLMQTYLNTWKS